MKDTFLKETISRIEKLKEQYKDDYVVRKNKTVLLGPGKIPKCRHMLFRPLEYNLIDEFLIQQYKHRMPEEYIRFLQYSNGATLYYVRIKTDSISFAQNILTVFGLPRTPPSEKRLVEEEPYDIRIESLSFNKKLPQTWLKCGTYTKNYDFINKCEIFIDTLTNKVYGCKRESDVIIDSWSTLDECLSSIMDSTKDIKEEYFCDL